MTRNLTSRWIIAAIFQSGTVCMCRAAVTVVCAPVEPFSTTEGSVVRFDCHLTTNAPQQLVGFQLDLPCTLTGDADSVGSVVSVGVTSDPDGDSGPGPGFDGAPYLFGGGGVDSADPATCVILGGPPTNQPAMLAPGARRYLGTIYYQISDCAAGGFEVRLENYSTPPSSSDITFILQASFVRIPFVHTGYNLLTDPIGSCCVDNVCAESANESCCQENHPGAHWFEGRTCADPVPCPQCLSDAECEDGVECTIDSCNSDTGACVQLANHAFCDDGLFCNGAEACHAAVGCVAGAAPCAPDLLCDEAAQQCTVPPIPTVSQWGLVVLALLLVVGAKLRSRRWSAGAASMTY